MVRFDLARDAKHVQDTCHISIRMEERPNVIIFQT